MNVRRQIETLAGAFHFALSAGHAFAALYHYIVTGRKGLIALHAAASVAEAKFVYDHVREAGQE